jgi:hypothetical protein
VRLGYLFLGASHFKEHPGAPAEPVLAAWRVDVDRKPVFVGLAPAASESADAWDDFLADLTQRGLRAPPLGIRDAAPGLTTGAGSVSRTSSSAPSGETHRRVRVIGRLPGERPCLSLVWALRGLTMTPGRCGCCLQDLRRQLLQHLPRRVIGQAVTAAAWHHRTLRPAPFHRS